MRVVCPYLYRDRENRFRCEVSGDTVDPGLMPCLSNYRECPLFVSASSKPAQQGAAPAASKSVIGETAAITAEVLPAVELRAAPEKGIEEMEEEVSEKIRRAEEMALDLNEKWKEYEEKARALMKLWEEVSANGRYTLEALSSVVELYERILENLDYMRESKRISEQAYNELREEAMSNLKKYQELRSGLEAALKNAERLVTPHLQRVKVAEARPELGKLRLSLMKLEEMYKEGKVSRETYEQVKKELEARIRWLEQLAGEVS